MTYEEIEACVEVELHGHQTYFEGRLQSIIPMSTGPVALVWQGSSLIAVALHAPGVQSATYSLRLKKLPPAQAGMEGERT